MFDRLGARKDLKPVKLKPWENTKQYLLGDVVKAPKRVNVTEVQHSPTADTEVSPAARHVAAALAKPKKVVVKVVPVATPKHKIPPTPPVPTIVLTDRQPRVGPTLRRDVIPKTYLRVFEKMTMGGPGILCKKKHGNVVAARLRQFLCKNQLPGRSIVQYWDDGDMVFWVDPDF